MFKGMTSLEEWCFCNIIFSFGSLISYILILINMDIYKKKSSVKPKADDGSPKRSVKIEVACFLFIFGTYVVYILQV